MPREAVGKYDLVYVGVFDLNENGITGRFIVYPAGGSDEIIATGNTGLVTGAEEAIREARALGLETIRAIDAGEI